MKSYYGPFFTLAIQLSISFSIPICFFVRACGVAILAMNWKIFSANANRSSYESAAKANATRNDEPHLAFLKNSYKKRIETTFSGIKNFFPKKIYAVTAQGFMLKIILFIFAYTLNQLV
jgi:hypothetical protein